MWVRHQTPKKKHMTSSNSPEGIEETARALPGACHWKEQRPIRTPESSRHRTRKTATTICLEIRRVRNGVNFFHRLPQKGNLRLCQNYKTISLINHSSNAIPWVLLNRVKLKGRQNISLQKHRLDSDNRGLCTVTVEQILNFKKNISCNNRASCTMLLISGMPSTVSGTIACGKQTEEQRFHGKHHMRVTVPL